MSAPALGFLTGEPHASGETLRLKKSRFDYFLIWGHGIPHLEEILEAIRRERDLEILTILRHRPRNLGKFVRVVYSCDYAPFEHLESKTRYLLSVPAEAVFVFVRNRDVQDEICGDGAHRHLECMRIKALKESIRDAFNPRRESVRSEDHVVHASDNTLQTDRILKYLGYREGIEFLRSGGHSMLDQIPHHIPSMRSFAVRRITMSKLVCKLLKKNCDRDAPLRFEIRSINESPHFECLEGNSQIYDDYYERLRGLVLTDDHCAENLLRLAEQFEYLAPPHETAYILSRYVPESDQYLVIDGLHRASILASQGATDAIVAVASAT